MVVLGHENTLAVTVDEMLHHTRAVRRAVHRSLVVADMPFGSYHGAVGEGLANAIRFIKEAGAEAVKIEGARFEIVRALTEAEIPVIGHLGLTPQSIHRMGGFRVQARTADAVLQLKADALALAEAGAGAIVLEGIPREVAAELTAELPIPTIGIGAGPDCDGQILVFHDLVSLTFAPAAKFVRCYADAGALIRSAIDRYREDVEHHAFPSDEESYHLPEAVRRVLDGMPRRERCGRSDGTPSHRGGTPPVVSRAEKPGPQRRRPSHRPGAHHGSFARGPRFADSRCRGQLRASSGQRFRQPHPVRAQRRLRPLSAHL
jgi:3-methyl-2-oxobutanoate hydroxymethyltransferase